MFILARGKLVQPDFDLDQFLNRLYITDSYLVASCLEGDPKSWEALFAARAGRADRLLVDALRSRAVRLYPQNEEKQETAVSDFWGHLLVSETPGSVPILARYDGLRPLVPWLIRTFQNWQVSKLRSPSARLESLPDDDLLQFDETKPESDLRWHEVFCVSAQEWLGTLNESELLLLGLRMRYRLSQREASKMFQVHEGTITRRIEKLRDGFLEKARRDLLEAGWLGDDPGPFIYNEMGTLLLDDPRLSADNLAHLLRQINATLPVAEETS